MPLRSSRWSGIALWFFTLCGCTGVSSDNQTAQLADSAGVTIITSPVPAWTNGQRWSVDPTPSFEVGVEDGDENYSLFRVTDALRLEGGRILIANSGTQQLRIYSADGLYVSSVGRRGAGPGEFAELSGMRICPLSGDTLLVDDSGNDRQQVFAGDEFVRSFQLESIQGHGRWFRVDCFSDGSLLTRAAIGDGGLRGAPGTILQTTWQAYRHSARGEALAPHIQFPDRPRVANNVGAITHYPFVPLHAAPYLEVAGEYVFHGDGLDHEIRRLDMTGNLRALLRWNPGERVRTADVYRRYKDATLAEMNEDGRVRYAHLYSRDLPLPEHVPLFQNIKADTEVNLWVERFRLPWDSVPTWEVFDSAGGWLGALNTPRNLEVLRIGSDYVLGRHVDELGIERVRLHHLSKP